MFQHRNATVSIDVLLICALKDEYDQALKVTEGLQANGWEEHPLADGWIVADACFTATSGSTLRIRATHASYMGREQAQATVSKLIHEQPARCIAMSGICAGRRGKVALGDVIFAERLWSYDAGKLTVEEDGESRFEGDQLQYRPSQTWVQRMQHVTPPTSTSWLSSRPALPLEQQENWVLLRILAGEQPSEHSDFKTACPNWGDVLPRLWQRKWLEKPLTLTDAGRQHAEELNLLNPEGLPTPTNFAIHVAPVATGAAVSEDAGIFPRLAKSMRKVLGVEMEASALGALGEVHDIPVLIAKGVSDYGDSFKDDRYREFAARASAECLIGLLRNAVDLLPPPYSDDLSQIPGVIEQGKTNKQEDNGKDAHYFNQTDQSAKTLQFFRPYLDAIKFPFERALTMYNATYKWQADNTKPESIDEILDALLELPDELYLIEFLVRVAQVYPDNPHCRELQRCLDRKEDWAIQLETAKRNLQDEANATKYLLVKLAEKAKIVTIDRVWLWSDLSAAPIPLDLENLNPTENLGKKISSLLGEVLEDDEVIIEVLAPAELLHPKFDWLSWQDYCAECNLEHQYPVVLRWLDRMEMGAQNKHKWKQVGLGVRQRINGNQYRAEWMGINESATEFCQQYHEGQRGELVGIPYAADDSGEKIISIIYQGGIPYACWPRYSHTNMSEASASIQQLIKAIPFDEIPKALMSLRAKKHNPLADILLLWDDHKRNPYDRKYSDITQRA